MLTSITHVAGSNRINKVGTQAMVFDAAGNLSSYAGKTFTHGADGRLRSSTTSAGTVTYQYDGLGRRVSKSGPTTLVPGGFVRYVYDTAHHLVGEYKADGTPIKEYVWIGDLPVAMIETHPDSTTTAYAIETDHLGTPRLLTDATRAPRWRWTSPPFGEVLPEDDPSELGAVTFNLRFPGQYFDKETGLHYNFNRYYDPGTGRYLQSDPIGLDGGWNTYGYVGGNPLSHSDPWGLIRIPGIQGATGETSVHANPGPGATDFRPEHGPAHVHLGANDGPRVRTSDFKPFSDEDARKMTRKQKQFCEGLADSAKDKIRKAQQSIFKHGRVILQIQGGGLLSIAAACRNDPIWCAEKIDAGVLP